MSEKSAKLDLFVLFHREEVERRAEGRPARYHSVAQTMIDRGEVKPEFEKLAREIELWHSVRVAHMPEKPARTSWVTDVPPCAEVTLIPFYECELPPLSSNRLQVVPQTPVLVHRLIIPEPAGLLIEDFCLGQLSVFGNQGGVSAAAFWKREYDRELEPVRFPRIVTRVGYCITMQVRNLINDPVVMRGALLECYRPVMDGARGYGASAHDFMEWIEHDAG